MSIRSSATHVKGTVRPKLTFHAFTVDDYADGGSGDNVSQSFWSVMEGNVAAGQK